MPSPMEMIRTPASRRSSSSTRPRLLRREKREKSLTMRMSYWWAHQAFPHGLVALPLLKGVAGAVPVLVEGEGAAGKFLLYKVLG